MVDPSVVAEVLLRGIALGALAATASSLARSSSSKAVRVGGVLFCASAIGYVVGSTEALGSLVGRARPFVQFVSLGGVGAFWLLVRALFEDRPLTPLGFAPYVALSAFGLLAMVVPSSPQPALWIVHNAAEVALAAHVLRVVQRSWRGDLVEARRRARGPFMAIVALFVVTLSVFEVVGDLGFKRDWFALAGAAALAVLCLGGAVVMLEARAALFGVPAARPAPTGPDPGANAADRAEIARLSGLMTDARLWGREGLTIGALAAELGVPEHRLRRLINDQLGHRNFAAFINAYRIDEAKRVLADPEQARKTVSSIAYDLGFGSLGPFNRAFKEATGMTPSQWRRQALEQGSPNSEKPRLI
jgi:AraC-like DNA-binding protein